MTLEPTSTLDPPSQSVLVDGRGWWPAPRAHLFLFLREHYPLPDLKEGCNENMYMKGLKRSWYGPRCELVPYRPRCRVERG